MIKINVYQTEGGEWYGARWVDGEWDGCDALDVAVGATEAEAVEHARTMSLRHAGERQVQAQR